MDDTLELREQLAHAWRSVLDGAVARGCPTEAVVETMVTVAHDRFAELFGAPAAASYLQLLAEQMRADERHDTVDLIQGDPGRPRPPPDDLGMAVDFGINPADQLL